MADSRSSPDEADADESQADESTASAGEADEAGNRASGADGTDVDGPESPDDETSSGELSTEDLRAQVESEYDFENFKPEDMKRMSPEEWDAAFDPDTWITGEELMDRVEADIKAAVVRRDVFARIERLSDPDRIVAYSDEGYAVVYGDGSIEGSGTVLRDVKPVVALCSMEEYEPSELPEGDLLPDPMEVPEGSGERGNLMLQIIAGAQGIAGLVLLGAGIFTGSPLLIVAGLGFLVITFLLFFTVANARLSDKFRAEEYRNRLRAVGVDAEDRPEFMDDLVREHPELAEPDEEDSETPS